MYLKGMRIDIGPRPIPTVPTDEIMVDCRIYEVQISAQAAVMISIADRQNPPMNLFPPMILPAGSSVSVTSPGGRPMPGGITWSASAEGAEGWIELMT